MLGINHLYDIFEEIDSKLEDKSIMPDLTSTTIELKEIEIVKSGHHIQKEYHSASVTSTVPDIPSNVEQKEQEHESIEENSIKANYDFCEDVLLINTNK